MSDQIRFEAQIIGYRPPYQWKLWRSQAGVSTRVAVKRGQETIGGESETFEGAVFDAQDAARGAYEEWLQENTKEDVVVLTAPATVEREAELLVAEPPRRPGLERAPRLGEVSD